MSSLQEEASSGISYCKVKRPVLTREPDNWLSTPSTTFLPKPWFWRKIGLLFFLYALYHCHFLSWSKWLHPSICAAKFWKENKITLTWIWSLTLFLSSAFRKSKSVVSEIPPCRIRTLLSIIVARGSQLKTSRRRHKICFQWSCKIYFYIRSYFWQILLLLSSRFCWSVCNSLYEKFCSGDILYCNSDKHVLTFTVGPFDCLCFFHVNFFLCIWLVLWMLLILSHRYLGIRD